MQKKLRSQEEIMSSWTTNVEPLVSISCITYNHELYIRDALEGFLIQETTFPFEILIHDDASSDKTAEIIREFEKEYPSLVKPIYQTENQYSQGHSVSDFNYSRMRGKYIALCEGDDFWTDSHKLQTQIDYMEKNPQCSMTFHPARIYAYDSFTNQLVSSSDIAAPANKDFVQCYKGGWFYEGGSSAPTASMVFRSEYARMEPAFIRDAPVGDMPLKLLLSFHGDVVFFDTIMSVRRKGTIGSWNPTYLFG